MMRIWLLYHVRSTRNKHEAQVLLETLTCHKNEAMQTSAARYRKAPAAERQS